MTDINTLKMKASQFSVLYVEDEPSVSEVVKHVLELFFKQVYFASNGKEGLELFIKHKKQIDMIFSDIQMPQMNGLEMSRVIKQNDATIPIVIITAHTDKEYFLQSIEVGVDRYLIKPVVQEKVIHVIHNLCSILDNQKKVKEYETLKLQQEVTTLSEYNINQLIETCESPIVVYSNSKISYFNTAFTMLFETELLNPFIAKAEPIESLFAHKEGCITSTGKISQKKGTQNRVCIITPQGDRYFHVAFHKILFAGTEKFSHVYTFYDLSVMQKNS